MPGRNTLKRRTSILESLNKEGKLSVSELSLLHNVSDVSIRNDLTHLEKKGLLIRTRGGAIKNQPINIDPNLNQRLKSNLKEKKKIGERAAKFVKEGDTIVMDSGSTTIEIAKHLTKLKNLKVVTNSLPIADILAENKNIKVILPGGVLRGEMKSLTGSLTEKIIQTFNCDIAFIGADSIISEKGIYTPSISEAALSNYMIQISNQTIVVADSSKLSRKSFVKITDFKDIHVLVTDQKILKEDLKIIESQKVQVITV
jgi:DeoR family transcriptional regulator of aga operon